MKFGQSFPKRANFRDFQIEFSEKDKNLSFLLGCGDGKAVCSIFERSAAVFFAEQFIKVSAIDVSDVAGYADYGAVGGN